MKEVGIDIVNQQPKLLSDSISNKQLSELILNVTKTSKKIPVLCSGR